MTDLNPSQSNQGADSITRFGESLSDSLNQLLDWGVSATTQAASIKEKIDIIRGKTNDTLAQQQTSQQNILDGTISPQLQNILVLVGIVAAGVGVIYLVRK